MEGCFYTKASARLISGLKLNRSNNSMKSHDFTQCWLLTVLKCTERSNPNTKEVPLNLVSRLCLQADGIKCHQMSEATASSDNWYPGHISRAAGKACLLSEHGCHLSQPSSASELCLPLDTDWHVPAKALKNLLICMCRMFQDWAKMNPWQEAFPNSPTSNHHLLFYRLSAPIRHLSTVLTSGVGCGLLWCFPCISVLT